MPLVEQPFSATFGFTRPAGASYRNAAGAIVEAAADVPRFDHQVSGQARGLLVQGRIEAAVADVMAVRVGGWEATGGTVFHEIETPAGVVVRRAYHTDNPAGTVNACLRAKGWHRAIGFVPKILAANQAGQINFRKRDFDLAGRLLVEPGVVLSHGDGAILEGPRS